MDGQPRDGEHQRDHRHEGHHPLLVPHALPAHVSTSRCLKQHGNNLKIHFDLEIIPYSLQSLIIKYS